MLQIAVSHPKYIRDQVVQTMLTSSS